MAYDFVRASSQYLSFADRATGIEPPFSMSVLVYSVDTTNSQFPLTIHDGQNPTDRHILALRGATAGDPIDAGTAKDDGLPGDESRTTSGYSASTWFNHAGIWAATNSRLVYLNVGGGATTNTTNISITGIIKTFIGASFASGVSAGYLDGKVAEVGIWSAALTVDEITSLSKGFKPYRIRPQSLLTYAPLVRDLQDIKSALAITNNATATVTNHPRVI